MNIKPAQLYFGFLLMSQCEINPVRQIFIHNCAAIVLRWVLNYEEVYLLVWVEKWSPQEC